ncbi:MAG TPA: hypothetical protein V6D19_13960 [Stenomitos sp.]
MSSGHASHKGSGIKHSHDSGQLDSAATTPAVNPEDLLEEDQGYPFDAEAEVNLEAIERPKTPSSPQDA